jgi:hypothetical protein
LHALDTDHLTISRVAASLGVRVAHREHAILAEGRRLLIDDPQRFDSAWVSFLSACWSSGRRPCAFLGLFSSTSTCI